MDEMQKGMMWQIFKELEVEAISMNHYDLAKKTAQKNAELWKMFLTDSEVSTFIEQEAQILAQIELRKLSKDVSGSRSVGQAQLINAMSKMTDVKQIKEGPVFIYTYVPLSPNQTKAENINVLTTDVFLKTKPDKIKLTQEEPESQNIVPTALTDADIF